jgi:hypothetical protein
MGPGESVRKAGWRLILKNVHLFAGRLRRFGHAIPLTVRPAKADVTLTHRIRLRNAITFEWKTRRGMFARERVSQHSLSSRIRSQMRKLGSHKHAKAGLRGRDTPAKGGLGGSRLPLNSGDLRADPLASAQA